MTVGAADTFDWFPNVSQRRERQSVWLVRTTQLSARQSFYRRRQHKINNLSHVYTTRRDSTGSHKKKKKKTFHFAKTQTSTPLFLLQLPLGCMYCYFLFISATEKKNANSSSQTANLFRFSLSSRDINNSPKKRFPCETRTLPMHNTQCNIVGSIKTPKHQNLKCICWKKSQYSGNAGILWKVKHQMPWQEFSLPRCNNMEQSAPCSCWMHYIKQYSCL